MVRAACFHNKITNDPNNIGTPGGDLQVNALIDLDGMQ